MSFLIKPFTDTLSGVREFFNQFFSIGPGGFWNTVKQILFYGLIVVIGLVGLFFIIQLKNAGGGGGSSPTFVLPPV